MCRGNRWHIPSEQTDVLEGLFVAGEEALSGQDVLNASAVAVILVDVLPKEKVWVENAEGRPNIIFAWHDYLLRFPGFILSRQHLAELLHVEADEPLGDMQWSATEDHSSLSPQSEELLRRFYVTPEWSVRHD